MEAYINPEIDYTNLSEIIKKQKETVKSIIQKFLNVKTTHKFLDLEKILKKHKSDVFKILIKFFK
jgi:histone acetyltransferase